MSDIMGEFKSKFKIEELKIYETNFWLWSLRPQQVTLGSGVLSLKRECSTFSELTPEEYCDLGKIIHVIETTLQTIFHYDVMNYLMLMMVDKQVHYHIIPRYEKEFKLLGETWIDNYWPGIPNLAGDVFENKELNKICMYIKENIKE